MVHDQRFRFLSSQVALPCFLLLYNFGEVAANSVTPICAFIDRTNTDFRMSNDGS